LTIDVSNIDRNDLDNIAQQLPELFVNPDRDDSLCFTPDRAGDHHKATE
jgi:hypothetical protein